MPTCKCNKKDLYSNYKTRKTQNDVSKFDRPVAINLRTASYLFGVLYNLVFDTKNLGFNHHLIAKI